MSREVVLWRPQPNNVYCMDALLFASQLESNSIHCVVTSPPYWMLRDYGTDGQMGLEPTLQEFISNQVNLFREIRRALRPDGILWLNMGDAYANDDKWGGSTGGKHAAGLHGNTGIGRHKRKTGFKPKDLLLMPHRLAIALQDDGWWIRQDNIWHKPNPMPESVKDRTTRAHEYVFMLTKSESYWYDADAVMEVAIEGTDMGLLRSRIDKESKFVSWHAQSIVDRQKKGVDSRTAGTGLRNKRSVWTIPTEPTPEAHFATFPTKLVDICIRAGCPVDGTVYDPFMGSGTTALVARQLGRNYIGSELNPVYVEIANRRLSKPYTPNMFEVGA